MNLFNSLHITQRQVERRQGRPDHGGGLSLFRRSGPSSGNNKVKTDYTGNTGGTRGFEGDLRPAGQRAAQGSRTRMAGSPYNSPVGDGSCGQNYIIYISNGAAQDNSSDIATASDGLARPRGATPPTIPRSRRQRIAGQHGRRMGAVHVPQSRTAS